MTPLGHHGPWVVFVDITCHMISARILDMVLIPKSSLVSSLTLYVLAYDTPCISGR